MNIKKSDVQKIVDKLNATSYTIVRKSNLVIKLLTLGIANYNLVKVIKRKN